MIARDRNHDCLWYSDAVVMLVLVAAASLAGCQSNRTRRTYSMQAYSYRTGFYSVSSAEELWILCDQVKTWFIEEGFVVSHDRALARSLSAWYPVAKVIVLRQDVEPMTLLLLRIEARQEPERELYLLDVGLSIKLEGPNDALFAERIERWDGLNEAFHAAFPEAPPCEKYKVERADGP